MSVIPKRMTGFTMVEMIAIMVLLGILSVVAYGRLNLNPIREGAFREEMRASIRFAQKFALVSACDVNVATGNFGYRLMLRADVGVSSDCLSATGAFTQALNRPGGGVYAEAPPTGVAVSASNFSFDRQGVPSSGVTITLGSGTIQVEPETGWVQ
ncbi:MAG: prepilin-type N-terminal cleavage/methylation domain-containing protein [Gammaproteobacteria bacterium]|nr:prepilin-type N-terminal cleavage/methylation domain-containing protein [Gammaproteobacteria bacterium]